MSYRDEIQTRSPGLPKGLYWGIYTKAFFGEDWKIDLWVMDHAEAEKHFANFRRLNEELNGSNREAVLTLKNSLHRHPKFRREFFSLDIYEAVLSGVKTVDEFAAWISEQRGVNLS